MYRLICTLYWLFQSIHQTNYYQVYQKTTGQGRPSWGLLDTCRQRKVRRIERVQNKILWARYAFRQAELRQRHGHQGENESLLFHGADKATLEAITNEGFDIRVSNAGTLGQGQTSALLSASWLHFCC